ncbi:hypothetical protein ACG5V6_14975 [Streptomyces chitinivorans]|uniref:Uncharacterized protein n=1 Tax=Streptomyces chitinivorans TaxID=1257027 RepID=A0ABW7HV97_9ACTN|nr:hypothetical protein [Streptomyces chitinivorans]MDH2407181.1 hypothetical protein [Streptomyces chitinivorans]
MSDTDRTATALGIAALQGDPAALDALLASHPPADALQAARAALWSLGVAIRATHDPAWIAEAVGGLQQLAIKHAGQ